jgi:hypothetical protein
VAGGAVLGIASTEVNPPARAAEVPVAQSSLWVAPGSRICTWTSTKPGNVIFFIGAKKKSLLKKKALIVAKGEKRPLCRFPALLDQLNGAALFDYTFRPILWIN